MTYRLFAVPAGPNFLVQRTRNSRCCLQFGRQWSRAADHHSHEDIHLP